MFPVIFSLGPFTVSTIGVFIALAFFFGGFGIWKKAKEEHFENDDIFDVIFLTFFGGIIFARIFYIIFDFNRFGFSFAKWINFTYSSRFYFLGFLFGFMYVLKLLSKKRKWNWFEFLDYAAIGVITGQIFLRIGQFFNMSYIGKPTKFFLGIDFPGIESRRHPVCLYEIIFLIIVIQIVKWLDKRYRLFRWYQRSRGKAAPGFLWLSYLLFFTIWQFFVEFLMIRKTVLWVFSGYQLFLIFFLLTVIFVFWLRAGNTISFIQSGEEEIEVIRKPLEEEKPKKRERRFKRAKSRKVGFK